MTDIVERLRYLTIHGDQAQVVTVMEEAAAEIERLRAVLSGLADAVADEVSRALEPKP